MVPSRSSRSASPTRGVLRGVRAGALAALCVLLPVVGHVLSQGHMPPWMIVLGLAGAAVPGAVLLTRRKLSDTQLLVALAAAQLAYHLAYTLPGACAAATDPGWLASQVEHLPVTGPPSEVLLAGHVITLALAARLLGLTERLLWRSKPLLNALRGLLLFVWPVLRTAYGPDADSRSLENGALPSSALVERLHSGRAPPNPGRGVSCRAPSR